MVVGSSFFTNMRTPVIPMTLPALPTASIASSVLQRG